MYIKNILTLLALSASVSVFPSTKDLSRSALDHLDDIIIYPDEAFKLQSDQKPLPKTLIQHDLDVLITALKTGYSGRHVHDKELFDRMIVALKKIQSSSDTVSYTDLQNSIREVIELLPDNHLYVMNIPSIENFASLEEDTTECSDCLSNPMQGQSDYRIEIVEMGGKKVLEIDIGDFMIPDNAVDNMVNTILETNPDSYDVVFVDLFDNPGGSITTVFELWSVLQGGYHGRDAFFIIEDTYNPISYAMNRNSVYMDIAFLRGMNNHMSDILGTQAKVDDFVLEGYRDQELIISSAIKGGALENMIIQRPESLNFKPLRDLPHEIRLCVDCESHIDYETMNYVIGTNSYEEGNMFHLDEELKETIDKIATKPIVIGINEHSASASELFTEGFYYNDNAIVIGHDSMGALHFMNPAMLWLKNISVVLSVPTGLFFFENGDSIETKGEHVSAEMVKQHQLEDMIKEIRTVEEDLDSNGYDSPEQQATITGNNPLIDYVKPHIQSSKALRTLLD